MSLETKYLGKLKHYQTLVDITIDRYDDFDFGYVVDFNEEFLLIERFDGTGMYDGYSLLLRDRVSRVRWGGNEIASITKLIDTTQREESDELAVGSMEEMLRYFNDRYGSISVHVQDVNDDVFFVGEIHELDNETLVLYEFGTKLSLDRKYIMISLDDITRVDANTQYSRTLEKLFVKKKKDQ
ncbi:hypothetical protein MKQ70_19385 [Chitinophaga sedimenti]|jgi:hypothetical protein|uniref:hypothetical protein n=1 Tax=Chitinophaga sedimenti TaxID=2033606 RepID=UPI002002D621|nr:hypothetical protein [Chitinophaga sedimenti]MCK7557051.1 hypothetical protein [Chitinophaga sedimenti]